MRQLLALLLAAFFVMPAHAAQLNAQEQQSKAAGCGAERIMVKDLDDPSAPFVHLRPVATTVHYLRSLPVPSGYNRFHDDRYKPELQAVAVQARIIGWKRETDRDFHIVISDPFNPRETMIAEPPDPTCPLMKASGYASQVAAVRSALVKCFGEPPKGKFTRIPGVHFIVAEGVPFFDIPHGQIGHAPNAIEIHPLLNIKFQGPNCGEHNVR